MSTFDDDDFFADIYDGSANPNENGPSAQDAIKNEPIDSSGAQNASNFSNPQIKSEEPEFKGDPNNQNASNLLSNDSKTAIDALLKSHSNTLNTGVPDQNESFQRRDGSATNTGQIYIPPKDEGKMFVGGLNWETTDESLRNYFSKFGELLDCTVMRDNMTGRSRGFGFLTFADAKCVNAVIAIDHFLDGRIIDPKRAIPREEQDKTAKIFVGGVGLDVTEEDFDQFFSKYGTVIDAQLMIDTKTGKPRGFGFITFDSHEAVERIVNEPVLILKDKAIEVKRAEPRLKDPNGNYINNTQSQNSNSNNNNNNNNHAHNNNHNNNNNAQNNNRFNNPYGGGYMGYNMGMAQGMNNPQGNDQPAGMNMNSMANMNPTMMMQYFTGWVNYFNQSEQMILRQGTSNPSSAQQLQQIRTMKQAFIGQMKNAGFDPQSLGLNMSGETNSDVGNNSNINNFAKQPGPSGNQSFDPREDSASQNSSGNGFNSNNEDSNENGYDANASDSEANNYPGDGQRMSRYDNNRENRFKPKGPRGYGPQNFGPEEGNAPYQNKSSAAITLLQGNESEQESHPGAQDALNDKADRRDYDSPNGKYGRERSSRESGKRHRSKYEDDDGYENDNDYGSSHSHHRSSREKSHKSRDLSLGDRIREDSRDGGSRKRRRADDDKDVSSRSHRSSSKEQDHRSSRYRDSGSKHRGNGKKSKYGDDSKKEKDGKDGSGKERGSKSPPLNAPTGPRGGSGSSFRPKGYKRYRSGHKN